MTNRPTMKVHREVILTKRLWINTIHGDDASVEAGPVKEGVKESWGDNEGVRILVIDMLPHRERQFCIESKYILYVYWCSHTV